MISSAVAIPSVAGLTERTREFVVYESSVSNIVGVLVFYAWLKSAGWLSHFLPALFGAMFLSLIAAVVAGIGFIYPVLLFLTAATTPGLDDFLFGAIMLFVLTTAALTVLSHHGQRRDLSAVKPIADVIARKES